MSPATKKLTVAVACAQSGGSAHASRMMDAVMPDYAPHVLAPPRIPLTDSLKWFLGKIL